MNFKCEKSPSTINDEAIQAPGAAGKLPICVAGCARADWLAAQRLDPRAGDNRGGGGWAVVEAVPGRVVLGGAGHHGRLDGRGAQHGRRIPRGRGRAATTPACGEGEGRRRRRGADLGHRRRRDRIDRLPAPFREAAVTPCGFTNFLHRIDAAVTTSFRDHASMVPGQDLQTQANERDNHEDIH